MSGVSREASSAHLRPLTGSLTGGLPAPKAQTEHQYQQEDQKQGRGDPPQAAIRRFGGGAPVLAPPAALPAAMKTPIADPHMRRVSFADQPNTKTQAKKQWGKGYWQRRREAQEARGARKGQKGAGKGK